MKTILLACVLTSVVFSNQCDQSIKRVNIEKHKYDLTDDSFTKTMFQKKYEISLIEVIAECKGEVSNKYKNELKKLKSKISLEKKRKLQEKQHQNSALARGAIIKNTGKFRDDDYTINILSSEGRQLAIIRASYNYMSKSNKPFVRDKVIRILSFKSPSEIVDLEKLNNEIKTSLEEKAKDYKIYNVEFK